MRLTLGAALAAVLLAACSSSSHDSFGLRNAAVDALWVCPPGSTNAPYDVNAKFDVHNPGSSSVSIQSVAAVMTLVAVSGTWLEKVGDTYDASARSFVPLRAVAHADTTVIVAIPSGCTSGKAGSAPGSHGDYRVTLTVTTSAGVYTITPSRSHRIAAG